MKNKKKTRKMQYVYYYCVFCTYYLYKLYEPSSQRTVLGRHHCHNRIISDNRNLDNVNGL